MTLEQEEFLMFTAMVAAGGAFMGVGVGWKDSKAPERTLQSTFLALAFWGAICFHSGGYLRISAGIFTALLSALGAYGGCKCAGPSQNKACLFSSVPAAAIASMLYYFFFVR